MVDKMAEWRAAERAVTKAAWTAETTVASSVHRMAAQKVVNSAALKAALMAETTVEPLAAPKVDSMAAC